MIWAQGVEPPSWLSPGRGHSPEEQKVVVVGEGGREGGSGIWEPLVYPMQPQLKIEPFFAEILK